MNRVKKCRCGKAIVFGVDEKGTRHPLDASAPVYLLREDAQAGSETLSVTRAVPTQSPDSDEFYRRGMVTHYATCPLANEFGKKRSPGGAAETAAPEEAAPGGVQSNPAPATDLYCSCGATPKHTPFSAVCKAPKTSPLPPPNRVPGVVPAMLAFTGYHVYSFSDDPVPGRTPPTAVMFALNIDDGKIGLRLKSPRAVNELIAVLERHRNDVWPAAGGRDS